MTLITKVKPVTRIEPDIKPPIPRQVLASQVTSPEKTRVHVVNKEGFRIREESKIAEVKPLSKPEPEPKPAFSSSTEAPIIKGTIVITLYKNRAYEVEFDGDITGADRDVAWRTMMKGYMQWKHKLAKANEARLKQLKEGGK